MFSWIGLLLIIFSLPSPKGDPAKAYAKHIKKHRKQIHRDFKSPDHSPFKNPEDRKAFDHLDFFPADLAYRVTAAVVRTPDAEPFVMKTSAGKEKTFKKWAILKFELKGQALELSVYQNLKLLERGGYDNYLFLPFKDHTNGESTYGGGRYIETAMPEGDTMEIDFNKCFNPYCAYSTGWNCPIVPEENHLDLAVEAGVKDWGQH